MAAANNKKRLSKSERFKTLKTVLSDAPEGHSTFHPAHPQPAQPYMPWDSVDRWLGDAGFFKAGQPVTISLDCARRCLVITAPREEESQAAREAKRVEYERQRKVEHTAMSKAWKKSAADWKRERVSRKAEAEGLLKSLMGERAQQADARV
ncbi:hypothetical protein [Paraburkholderia solisilvae]|uniref:Uncharacterized protein n=1 Tax=Paraburkholderia solisilvae TaxID=624376 RepID=A0A6J5ESE8_9BURK|nr:hypothetical protein [Paraburkholderia solisilvae]CAB3768112.1 hypothetical protein LMG29739_05237 [Paraburkholderia solisilvae]